MQYNSGTFKQQYEYKSFSPSLLKEPFEWKSDEVMDLLSQADRAISELKAYAAIVPERKYLHYMHKVKEATNSTRIEGTQTLIDEAILKEKQVQPEKRDDWKEVQNYIAALDYAMERMDDLPLSIRLTKEIHKVLLTNSRGEDKLPGEIRKSQNWIGGANIKSAAFIPPHFEELAELLSDLEKFWHDHEWKLPALIRIAISHYQFETIHPFLDGNGRTGRLIIILQFLYYGLLDSPNLYLSSFFEKHRGEYIDALTRVTASHDMDHWIRFFLTGVIESANDSIETFNRVKDLVEDYRSRIENLGRRRKYATILLDHLYSQPIITSNEVSAILDVTPATANRLIEAMVSQKILTEKTGYARNRLFELHEFVEIFK